MTKRNVPAPACFTCGKTDAVNYGEGETVYVCPNCGTEMRYLPAGELLHASGTTVKRNNGWITRYSVRSSELHTARAMSGVGILILSFSISFFFFGKINYDAAMLCSVSGVVLIILGTRKVMTQKNKTRKVLAEYPFWNR
jgi:hypothetical protein